MWFDIDIQIAVECGTFHFILRIFLLFKISSIANGSSSKLLFFADTFIPSDPTPLPNLNLGTTDDHHVSGHPPPGVVITANNADASVDVDVCCKRFIPGTHIRRSIFIGKCRELYLAAKGHVCHLYTYLACFSWKQENMITPRQTQNNYSKRVWLENTHIRQLFNMQMSIWDNHRLMRKHYRTIFISWFLSQLNQVSSSTDMMKGLANSRLEMCLEKACSYTMIIPFRSLLCDKNQQTPRLFFPRESRSARVLQDDWRVQPEREPLLRVDIFLHDPDCDSLFRCHQHPRQRRTLFVGNELGGKSSRHVWHR